MTQHTAIRRILALATVAMLLSFSFVVLAHSHEGGHEDQQCRLCHFAHTTPIDLSHGVVLPAPMPLHQASVAASIDPQLELVFHQIASRAPPSPAHLS